MQPIPSWLQEAFSDWLTGRIYIDGRGNYRSRLHRRPIIPCNRSLKRLYPDNQAFHRAAQIWLELCDVVPFARLTDSAANRPGGALMRSRNTVVWREVVDELANALEVAIGFAAQVRRNARMTADDVVRLEGSIARAVSVLKQLQPRSPARKGRRSAK